MSEPKNELRRKMLEQRGRLGEQARREKSKAICRSIVAELERMPALLSGGKSLFTFMPFGHETDILPVAEWCWSRGIPVVAPRTVKEPRMLQLRRIAGTHELVSGVWGIPEPSPAAIPAVPEELGAVLVPGVAFDRSGGRLGYGGGYYDRFFASLREAGSGMAPPLKLAPAFEIQLAGRIPMEPHDERVDLIVTETARYECDWPDRRNR